jgi:hypothetical protein
MTKKKETLQWPKRRTDITMTTKKINKEQIMIYKPLLRELKIKQHETGDKSWMRKGPDCVYDKRNKHMTQIFRSG